MTENSIQSIPDTSTTAPIGLLTGKVVLITGASRGIGAAAARLFAREGAAVVLAARSAAALDTVVDQVRVAGGVADAVPLDLPTRRASALRSDGSTSSTDGSTARSTTARRSSTPARSTPRATRTSTRSSP
jgi:NAD(P)-dependent dehydrogenase (short-subunit alcohol dehydrogenase family)